MSTKTLVLKNRLGLHARAASAFVRLSTRFKSDIQILKDGQIANGKSIMGLLALAAPPGSQISLSVNGEDETEAMEALCALVDNGFGELGPNPHNS